MKVLLVIHDFLPYHAGGSEIATYRLARGLLRLGIEAELLFTDAHIDREQYALSTGTYEGIPFHEVVYNQQFADFEEMYDDPAMARVFEKVVESVRPDVVHFESLVVFGFGCVRAAKRRHLPVAVTLHDYYLLCQRSGLLMMEDETLCPDRTADQCARCMESHPLQPEKYGADPRAFDRRAVFTKAVERRMARVRELLPHVDLFTAPSHFLREMMVKHGLPADRIVMSDNGYELAPFEATARARRETTAPLRLGYIGGLTPWKGVHLLLEACRALAPEKYRLTLYGDRRWFPDYVARLDQLAARLPARFGGTYVNHEVARILSELDAIVVPSVWFENSPMTIHEAALARVPVIATDLGGMREFVQDGVNGLLFRRNDVADLAAKLRAIVDEPDRLLRLRVACGGDGVKSCEEDASEWRRRYEELVAGARA